MRFLAALLFTSFLGSCAAQTPAQCRERADEAYRQCANPAFMPESDLNEPTRADDAQRCRTSHMQAIEKCEEKPAAPTPEIRPDAG